MADDWEVLLNHLIMNFKNKMGDREESDFKTG